ncbi:dehydrogenase [bacterium (Candidatus Blackallbacteria) CG17_big_fil_post_rev_8_21_14_2_50_48_46]|uniref:Dehydrogenase n=1 Tax=bacterium (Candidatus Blackallbacteria) CG17_big_fil_post_rev_8_21_14_2_50_48_46 TaxID=2014261 RepID=A0A2M7GAA7_9BACT|nr:MAG: dehydrogenase [bacterium (Candidatus Blackallbacteria) CG18_big_fil_WC_8_21_14_2_50_49_26]PIW19078.1 MAG: dehydrogenase [bacterium (Candidatus Blackallbacteria) CG17_big_fil_post_rev_8_21_14_2_50_48_46]PIW44555.1 MAG: dehydrogenase [bacterium (Candidatus Blackallbacteria) CG13_big_fil_rev_8_21_14_2_50_49_14]
MSLSVKLTQAAILAESRKPLIVDEIHLPETLEAGQVLVELFYSGICGSQIGEIDAVKGEDKYLPHLLGHEGVGKVLEIGPGVRHVKPGETVVLHWRKGLGIEAQPAVYQWRGKPLNAGWVTTFNRHAIVAENRCTPIPADFDLELAPLFGCAVTTALGVLQNNAQLKIGESVVILGAGGVGLNMIQGAEMMTAYPIVAVDLYDHRLELARQLGATHTINSRELSPDALAEQLRAIVGPAGADVVIDNTGMPGLIEMAYNLSKNQGRTILVGVPKAGNNISVFSLKLHFGKVLTGSHGGDAEPHLEIPRYLELCKQGKLKLKALISQHYSLEQINEAIADMREGRSAGRCLIYMGDTP